MNKISAEKLQQKIRRYFQSHPYAAIKKSKLIKDLKIKNEAVHHFKEIMASLVQENFIEKVKSSSYQLVKQFESDLQGAIQITKSGIAFVQVDELKQEVLIKRSDIGNALNGDIVAVEITKEGKRGPEGHVLDVLKRKRTRFVGILESHPKFGFVIADDSKIHHDFFIPQRHLNGAEDGQKVLVELILFEPESRRPEGKIIEILGYPDEAGVDIQSVFKAHDINESFEKAVLQEADQLKLNCSKEEIASRLDLRNELIFTIDPVDAKDFDDAVSLKKVNDRHVELGVHIADVSHFVQENSELDKEALQRGCSVYLVDRVIPMLPEKLANELCSLKPNEDRFTYSAFMTIERSSLDVLSYRIKKSIINSKRRFTYEEAQDILDGEEDDFSEILLDMNDLAKQIRKKRFESGSIDFHTPEVRFTLDEDGKPTGIVRKKQLESMKLIEEFMLLANKTVAKHIHYLSEKSKSECPFVYRIHEQPSTQKIDFLQSFLNGMGIEMKFPDKITPKIFQNMVGPLLAGPEADIINDVAVRSMMKARYSPENVGHFGLGFDFYSHFTSPIRRYPDLIVHRMLFEYEHGMASKRRRHYRRFLNPACELSSANEKNASVAERESVKLKQVEFISDHLNECFMGKISGVTDFGIFVEIEDFLIEGLVPLRSMKDDHYIFDGKTISVRGRSNGRSYRLGQRVKIEVVEVNQRTQQIDFELRED